MSAAGQYVKSGGMVQSASSEEMERFMRDRQQLRAMGELSARVDHLASSLERLREEVREMARRG